MKLRKWVKIVLLIIILIILGLLILKIKNIYNDFKMKNKLNNEIEQIQYIIQSANFDETKYKKKLSQTVTKGNYYKVEKSYKNYLSDYLSIENRINDYYDKLEKSNLLSTENIVADGKDFLNTRSVLSTYSNELDELKKEFDSMSSEDNVMSYLDNDLDDYYKDLFKEYIGDIYQTSEEKEISLSLSKSSKYLKDIKRVYDYLSENKDNWTIDENTILFDSETYLNEYNRLIDIISVEK